MPHPVLVPEVLVEGRGSRVVGLGSFSGWLCQGPPVQSGTRSPDIVFGTRRLVISQVAAWENVWVEDSTFDGTRHMH